MSLRQRHGLEKAGFVLTLIGNVKNPSVGPTNPAQFPPNLRSKTHGLVAPHRVSTERYWGRRKGVAGRDATVALRNGSVVFNYCATTVAQ